MLLALFPALGLCFAAYRYSDRLVLIMIGASELPFEEARDLHRLATRLALRAGLPRPRLYLITSETPNALATGCCPRMATVTLTTGLLATLSRDELGGVLAHELAHIHERDTLLSTVVAAVVGLVSRFSPRRPCTVSQRRGPGEENLSVMRLLVDWLASRLAIVLARLDALLYRFVIPHWREYEADAEGACMLGDPLPLARALEKLELANQKSPLDIGAGPEHLLTVHPCGGDAPVELFNAHPPTTERVSRLRAMALQPGWPEGWRGAERARGEW